MNRKTVYSIGVFWVLVGCAELDTHITDGADKKARMTVTQFDEIYPVEPEVHLEYVDGIESVADARPRVLNAVAYARYAVDMLGDSVSGRSESAHEIARALAREASMSGISLRQTLSYGQVKGTEAAYSHYRDELMHDAQTGTPIRPLSRHAKGIVDGRAKVQACTADGHGVGQCCQALLWNDSFQSSLDPELEYEANTEALLAQQDLEISQGTRANIQPFNQSAIRSWLSYCGGIISDGPSDLYAFKARFGDFHHNPQWAKEMHPISPAKQAGRRIFRTVLEDGTWVSIAESTHDDCSVRETETIVRKPGQQAIFWVFDALGQRVDHAYFPTRRMNEDAIRFAPNSCMGCHYTVDTRRFDIATPSFEALNLKLFETDQGAVWRDHSHCGQPDEPLIYHQVPIAGHE